MSPSDRHVAPPFLSNRDKMLFIDGRWQPSASRESIETFNPATGQVLATLARGQKEDVDLAAPTIPGVALDFDETSPEGASFSEFTLHLDDSPSR